MRRIPVSTLTAAAGRLIVALLQMHREQRHDQSGRGRGASRGQHPCDLPLPQR